MTSIELASPAEIWRYVESLNRHGRAPLSAYWEICLLGGAYLDDLKFPVSRVVSGDVEKKAMRLKETGRIGKLSKGRGIVWERFDQGVARILKKIGLISIEARGERVFVHPEVDRLIFRVGGGYQVVRVEEITEAHRLIRSLRGASRTRLNFDKRLRYEVPDTVEIVFPLPQ